MQLNTIRILGPSRIAIIGAGEFGKQALHYILQNNNNKKNIEIVGWYDDTIPVGKSINDFPVMGQINSVLKDYYRGLFDSIFIAIGYNHPDFKLSLIKTFKDKIPLFNIISPEAHVDATAEIGQNVFIYPGAIIDKDVTLKDGVTINLGSIVSHNSTIEDCCFLAPGVTIAGFSHIKNCSFLGVGSIVKDNVCICNNVYLGAGCVVVKNITKSGTYIGIPAYFLDK